jgi:hypothetical protein
MRIVRGIFMGDTEPSGADFPTLGQRRSPFDQGRMERGVLKRDDVGLGVLLTAEYEQLKVEQTQRISTRDNLMYASLAAVAGVFAVAYQAQSIDLILLLPPGCVILGWTYLANDEKISAIGRYIRLDLGPRLSQLVDSPQPIFGWEHAHRSDRRRRSRKICQLGVDLLTFCAPGLIAIGARLMSAGSSITTAVIAAIEMTLVLILGTQITVNADLTRDRSWSAADDDILSGTRHTAR